MKIFVDTSAIMALMEAKDRNHAAAKQVWSYLLTQDADLICTNYVLLESWALIQNRLGIMAVADFQESIVPLLYVEWIDQALHEAGIAAVLTANRRQLSLVDCLSFIIARRLGINTVFAFDSHFEEQGFTSLT